MSGPPSQIRLLLVEDVPQVAQYIRGLLSAQRQITLVDVLSDGRQVREQIAQLRPDVLMVDALLQGKVNGLTVAAEVRGAGNQLPIIVLTVPQRPVAVDPASGVDHVLRMPFSGYELLNLVQSAMAAHRAEAAAEGQSRVFTVHGPKGGIGRTTIAFNLAVALNQVSGRKTVLVDGSLQFADLRNLLKVPHDAPSILDLPTDRIQEGDLSDVLWRDPSGIDLLLAPPRIEMAEMVTTRDVEKLFSILRRVYSFVVVDTPAGMTDVVLAFLDQSETIIEVVTYESTAIQNTRALRETFRAIGYPASKIRYLLNRSDWSAGIDPQVLTNALGGAPDFTIRSDGRLVVESNNQGVPFVLADPAAPITQDLTGIAAALAGTGVPAGAATR
ncbi:MAG: response regulator [Chloroflexota bacterium]|nr:response regulator [Chloroflexota bacterium]